MLSSQSKKRYYQTLLKKNTGIEVPFSGEHQSIHELNDIFSKLVAPTPTDLAQPNRLKASWFDTILGPMVAIASEEALYLLAFLDYEGLDREVARVKIKTKCTIIAGTSPITRSIQHEIDAYFNDTLNTFKTPVCLLGSPFQLQVWEALKKIPLGETRSYSDLARSIKKPRANRAVAQANSANPLAIIIPCHRVIYHNGELGGYASGIRRKKWLIHHESNYVSSQE